MSEFEYINLKCRACLKQEDDMNLLFFSYDGVTTFAKMLGETLGFPIMKEEGYSEKLCLTCTKIVADFYTFKGTFQLATEYFKSKYFDGKETQYKNTIKDKTECTNLVTSSKIPKADHTTSAPESPNIISYSNHTTMFYCQLQGQQRKKVCRPKLICKTKNTVSEVKTNVEGAYNTICWETSENHSKKMCKICKKQFFLEDYESHLDTHKIHTCKTCNHRFIRKTDLNDHEETHLNVSKYVCQHCGKAFKVRTALNKHRRIHTNPREEICDGCGKRFNTRDTLKIHYRLKHLKSKDFQCNMCGLAFTLKATLEKHIERHNPERKRIYSCKLCNISYIHKYNLSRHYMTKHTAFESKPTCNFCGKKYTKKIDLSTHLKKFHGNSKHPA